MKSISIVAMVCVVLFCGQLLAQELTRDDFRDAEWKMKSLLWQEQQNKGEQLDVLDQTDFDVRYWELEVDVTDIGGQSITGRVKMTSESAINGLTGIDYNYDSAMNVDSVKMGGQTVSYTHNGDILHITLNQTYDMGQQFTTEVFYGGHPPGGGFGSFTWDTHGGRPIISTLSEPEGAREWWPCKDMPHDKADSADVYIITPDNLTGTSNGVLVGEVDNGNGTKTYHWQISYPITTYLICMSISNYQSFTDWYVNANNDSMPVTNYVYPEHYNNAVEDLSITPGAIAVFAGLFGEYPFLKEKYGHSIFPWGGAMEHQCNTSYGSGLINGQHSYDWILVHELSHQWFGDMITCDIWPDIWMNEGFASYCEALWTEQLQGYSAYVNYMRFNNGVSDPSGPIYDPNPLFDGNTVYSKGAWVVHMLRGVMGDEAFFEGFYAYANHPDHKYGTITTREFQAIMEQYYGADLAFFFDEWVWGMNRPKYTYSWMKEDIGGGQYEIFLHINQTQTSPAPEVFTMPIRIYPEINGQDTVITVWDDSRQDDFRFIVNGDPTQFRFDRYYWILRDATVASYGLNIVTTDVPDGYVGESYNATVEARGGTAPYEFTLQTGSLPPGLDLSSSTGEITGTPNTTGDYSFTIRCTDSTNATDDQDYQVSITYFNDVNEGSSVPKDFALIGNYPNPFNNSTIISFRLGQPGNIDLKVYNIRGQMVAALYVGFLPAGQHSLVWDAETAPSGIYFYKLTAGDRSATRKMSLVK